ncbi:MAG: Gfo/Idh/MocA family oxidoreductase [Anaerolineae bacterium]|nr:Gfo/Idh/MocA family oxidoreductase [Anaerolineae bacterium]
MSKLLRAAVIGVGSMGRNHARVYAEMEDVQLIAVADVDQAAAVRVANIYGVRAYADYRMMLEAEPLDLVTIAVPTRLHREVAEEAAAHGVHLFVEKPLAGSVEDARAIIDAARAAGVKLGVGHIERFNPAILQLKVELDAGRLGRMFQLHARRVGPFPPRVEDVGVVFDLATHELNIMEYLANARVVSLYAETEREIHEQHEDLLSGVIKLDNGVVGVLDINWLTPTKIRELSVIGERGMFRVNYLTQELYLHENSFFSENWESAVALMGVSEGRTIKYEIKRKEPLKAELESFVEAIREDKPPAIGGEEGLRAVFLAQKLVESGLRHEVVHL